MEIGMTRHIRIIDAGTIAIQFVIFNRNTKEVVSAYKERPISDSILGWEKSAR